MWWWVPVRLRGRPIFLARMRRARTELRRILIRSSSWHGVLYLDALASDDGVELVEGESLELALEQRLALGKLSLDPVDMAARGERLPVSVLLIALYARRRAGRTLWMLGVALRGQRTPFSDREMPNNCRSQPTALALIFLLLHRAQASCDRLSRRGSLADMLSSPSPAVFLRLRGPALELAPSCPFCGD